MSGAIEPAIEDAAADAIPRGIRIPPDHAWARDLRDRRQAARVASYFEQSAGVRIETGVTLDYARHEAFPRVRGRARVFSTQLR